MLVGIGFLHSIGLGPFIKKCSVCVSTHVLQFIVAHFVSSPNLFKEVPKQRARVASSIPPQASGLRNISPCSLRIQAWGILPWSLLAQQELKGPGRWEPFRLIHLSSSHTGTGQTLGMEGQRGWLSS